MKREILKEYSFLFLFFVFVVISRLLHFGPEKQITRNFTGFLFEMLAFIPILFILIGLFDVWVPKEKIHRHIGENSGFKGMAVMLLLAMFQAGPLYGAFPVAYLLWQKGCSTRNIFIYLGAFSTLKIPLLSFEIGFLGLKFSLLRTIISIPVFIVIAEIMTMYLKNRKFEIKG